MLLSDRLDLEDLCRKKERKLLRVCKEVGFSYLFLLRVFLFQFSRGHLSISISSQFGMYALIRLLTQIVSSLCLLMLRIRRERSRVTSSNSFEREVEPVTSLTEKYHSDRHLVFD